MSNKDIKNEISDSKDFQVFVHSNGGSKLLKKTKGDIINSVMGLLDVRANDTEGVIAIVSDIKASLRVYSLLTGVDEELEGLREALDSEEE
jgi:hypothetical protein